MKDKKENAQPSKQDLAESGKSKTKEWIKDLGTALVIALVFLQLLTPTLVREHSMENTMHQNDYVFVSRRHYSWFGNDLKRGDIITFDSELTTGLGFKKILVKRIIGLPGDKISISGGKVYINGEAQDEPYTRDGYTSSEMDEVTVPEGYIFAMGDNRQNSTDSRSPQVGFIDINRIRGKVVFRLFPVSGFGAM
ncbi:MAG: signal peptidase I [Firmicutes bacterium]|nr:signal peptidase I [Bacillota bacterium]